MEMHQSQPKMTKIQPHTPPKIDQNPVPDHPPPKWPKSRLKHFTMAINKARIYLNGPSPILNQPKPAPDPMKLGKFSSICPKVRPEFPEIGKIEFKMAKYQAMIQLNEPNPHQKMAKTKTLTF